MWELASNRVGWLPFFVLCQMVCVQDGESVDDDRNQTIQEYRPCSQFLNPAETHGQDNEETYPLA